MNAVELRLWKIHEEEAEAAMQKQIDSDKAALEMRKRFIDRLDKLFGEMLPDLIDGSIYLPNGYMYDWSLPIKFRGVEGYIQTDAYGTLSMKLGRSNIEYPDYSHPDKIAKRLEVLATIHNRTA